MTVKIKLSANDKEVLKMLVLNSRVPCTEIAQKLGITSQAVGKIKNKLEKTGVIRGYSVMVDYDRLGIEVLAIAMFRFKSGAWTRLEDEDIRNQVRGPHLITVYRFSEGDVTHMITYGFRSLKELDNYFHILQTERGHISELKKLYILSVGSILKDSPAELIIKAVNEMGKEKLATPETPKPFPEN
jgi:DNA-binding Lrp family transcriptional regulator